MIAHFGEFCVIVNKGYKVFDFKKNAVIKIFRSEISEKVISNEIEVLKKSQNTQYAPDLLRWNIEEKWYQEQLIRGIRDFSHYPRKTFNLLNSFKKTIEPAIRKIIFSNSLNTYPVTHIHKIYTERIAKALTAAPDLKSNSKIKIDRFIDSQLKILNHEIDSNILFGFTHGDFCPANILNTSNGVKLIDWEGAAFRSILFDFYSYFFYRPTHQIFNNFYVLHNEINQALKILFSNTDPKFKEIKESISGKNNIYRVVYYIERIIMLTERISQDEKLNIEKEILNFINVFEKYEAENKALNLSEISQIGN
jgi:thiamine kinase-like enzyme